MGVMEATVVASVVRAVLWYNIFYRHGTDTVLAFPLCKWCTVTERPNRVGHLLAVVVIPTPDAWNCGDRFPETPVPTMTVFILGNFPQTRVPRMRVMNA